MIIKILCKKILLFLLISLVVFYPNSSLYAAGKEAEEHNKRGLKYLDKEEYESALKEFNLAIQLDSNYAEAIKNRGNVYYYQGKLEPALKDYLKAISVDPAYWQAYNNAANVYWDMENVQNSLEYYDKAIKANPSAVLPYWNAGNKYLDLKQYDTAIQYFQKGLKIEPNNEEFHAYLGYTLYQVKRVNEATEHMNKAIKLNPEYSIPYYDLATIYYDKAMELNRKYVDSTTNTEADKKLAEGSFNLYNQALENFSKAVELEPDNARYRYRLGLTYFALVEDDKALDEYRTGIDLAREQGLSELVKLIQDQINKIQELKEKRKGGNKNK
ncbi:MAG TPA: tetratricopeptide repeat protein [Candidatus Eremiobacteraeota bacterium]|nr:MAG: TPR repeat-containing protein YrrB [bacterium ADurb.Bin363]HPZ06774.1 tetratricopeptide repeat protein [Candidatus Eremiobacteraeota bacterium]